MVKDGELEGFCQDKDIYQRMEVDEEPRVSVRIRISTNEWR